MSSALTPAEIQNLKKAIAQAAKGTWSKYGTALPAGSRIALSDVECKSASISSFEQGKYVIRITPEMANDFANRLSETVHPVALEILSRVPASQAGKFTTAVKGIIATYTNQSILNTILNSCGVVYMPPGVVITRLSPDACADPPNAQPIAFADMMTGTIVALLNEDPVIVAALRPRTGERTLTRQEASNLVQGVTITGFTTDNGVSGWIWALVAFVAIVIIIIVIVAIVMAVKKKNAATKAIELTPIIPVIA